MEEYGTINAFYFLKIVFLSAHHAHIYNMRSQD